jgi:hypothetical protein
MRKRIDWNRIDPLIKKYLPSLTIVEFTEQHAPETIPRTIGQRAKKLGIKPAPKTISEAHKTAVSHAVSRYIPTEEIDDLLKSNNGKASVPEMASRIGWSAYAVRKRLRELNLPVIRKRGSDYIAPLSDRIDWGEYDIVLKRELPNHTIAEFRAFLMPFASTKAIGARARKLGIKPHQYKPSNEHKEKIADGVRQFEFTGEMDSFIRKHKDDMGQKEIAEHFGLDDLVIWRRMGELGIRRSLESLKAVMSEHGKRTGHLGGHATRNKLLNMSEEELIAYRQKCSLAAQRAFKEGRIKPHHGIGQKMNTRKGGKFSTRSSYETRYVALLEADSEVLSFEYEPFTIDYRYGGITRCYTPDFLVEYADRIELVEVKPKRFLDIERNPAKFKAAEEHCIEEGLVFKVVTEDGL